MHARNYRPVVGQAYTRKKFAKGFPPPKIVKFTMGDTKAAFEYELSLIGLKRVQIRHNALEAARIAVNRILNDRLLEEYFLKIRIFGAHADRLQQGMRRSFGTPTGTAARVEPGQTLITVKVNTNGLEAAKQALKRGKSKLPVTCKLVVKKIEPPKAPDKVESEKEKI